MRTRPPQLIYNNMKVLNLIIKQNWFDEILSGKKTVEHREIRAKTAHRYVEYYDEDAKKVYKTYKEDEGGENTICRPIKYDAIRFFVGYSKDRDSALVEVKGAEIVILTDENGNDIVYEYDGREFVAAQIDYTLGRVIEKNIH